MRVFLATAILAAAIAQTAAFLTTPANAVDPQIPATEDSPAKPESEDPDSGNDPDMSTMYNLPMKTIGGTQLWTDHVHRSGYRIQRNALTGHWRLLDAGDVRRSWGTRETCQQELDRLQPPDENARPRHTVLLLHGLMRTRHSMTTLEKAIVDQADSDVIRFSYASTRGSIGGHAQALREILEGLPPETEFSFVGHSMGNIIVRHLIGDLQRDGDPFHVLARCRSMVMLGPPNQGAAIAKRLAPTGLYGLVTGKGGIELGPQWDELVEKLATPPFPFSIIAGDVSENRIQNPIVDGSSDFVVSVDEAKLEGAESVHTVPVLHSFLMNDPESMKLTIEFINSHRSAATAHEGGDQ